MNSVIEKLVGNILETKFETFAKEVVEDAKNGIIDVVGCAIGGANASGNSAVLDLVKECGGKKEATILVHGGKVPAHNAAMVNAIMARSYDYEGGSPGIPGRMTGHISATTVPTAFAVAEQRELSGKELLTALILGGDLAARIGAAEDFSFQHGWDITGTVNKFGATAIAGRLWSLDRSQMLNAFGIVVNQLAGTFQSIWDSAHTFKLHQGLSAKDGVFSVELASKGFTGVRDPLFSKHGYFALYCSSYDPKYLTEDLGKVFYAKGLHKLYPCCRGNHGAIDCALELTRKYDIEPTNIDEVIVDLTPGIYANFTSKPFEIREVPQVDATFSTPYNVANILVRKSIKLEHFTAEFIKDPQVVELTRKVKLTGTLPPENWLACTVTVKMTDGRQFSTHVDVPTGDMIQSPLSRDDIKDKFWANVTFSNTVSRQKAVEVLNMLENIEDIDKVTRIIELLAV